MPRSLRSRAVAFCGAISAICSAEILVAGPARADVPGDVSSTAYIKVGPLSTKGNFIPTKDSDWYRVKLTAGQDYAAYLVDSSQGDLSQLAIRNVLGAVQKKSQDVGLFSTGFEFRPIANSEYFLDATGITHTSPSDHTTYEVAIAIDCNRSKLTKCLIAPNSSVNGSWLYPGDQDLLRLFVVRGKKYDLSIDDASFPTDVRYSLGFVKTSGESSTVYYDWPFAGNNKIKFIYKANRTELIYVDVTMREEWQANRPVKKFNFPYKLSVKVLAP